MSSARRGSARPRRRYPRLTLRVAVAIESPTVRLEATATTLGAGGLFVAIAEPLPLHAPLLVRFRLPGDDTELCCHAHVAWRREAGSPGMGISLDDADARSDLAARLERWADLQEASRSGASRS